MTQEDKQLLLADLCGRLPYGVVVVLDEKFGFNKGTRPLVKELLDLYCVEGMKPYLRPISSMTEEESAELSNIISEWFDKELFYLTEEPFLEYALSRINYSISPLLFDWLNAHHFDYRGIIEKGLALEAPEGMYKNE